MFPLQDETKLIEIELLAPLIIRNSQSGNNTLYRHHHNARLSHGSILAAEARASRAVIGSSSCRMTSKQEVTVLLPVCRQLARHRTPRVGMLTGTTSGVLGPVVLGNAPACSLFLF